MKNFAPNNEYRNCVDKKAGDCPYMIRNKYDTACCAVDGIVQVEYFGCVPKDVIFKESMKDKEQ